MCRIQMLRSLVTQRLTAAAEEILGLFERTMEQYEEECSCSKEDRQRVVLDAICGSAHSPKMSRVQMLRVLVNQRLTAAVEETFGLIEKTIVGYEEETDRQRMLVEDCVKPEIQINKADSPQLFVFKVELDPDSPHIKEEQEELWTTQEGEQFQGLEADITKFPLTPVPVKSENDEEKLQYPQHSLTQTEESREAEPLASTSTEEMETEADGEDCGLSEPSEPTSNLTLASDVQEPTSNVTPASDVQPTSDGQLSSDCSETEDSDDDWKETSDAQSCLDTPKNKESHVSHKRSHTGEKTFSCTVCGKSFSVNGHLKTHMRLHPGEKAFSCSVCGKAFHQKGNMHVHMRSHTGDKPFICSVCGTRFGYKRSLQRHMTTHTAGKPFDCTVCGKKFGLKCRLQRHMVLHTGEKPFSCSVCGKQFSQSGAVSTHMRSHTGDRPFSCLVCNNSFGRRAILVRHMRLHTGERPYVCTVCNKDFSQSWSLVIHMRLHTEDKQFSCSVCSKRFSAKGNLTAHTRIHTREKQ